MNFSIIDRLRSILRYVFDPIFDKNPGFSSKNREFMSDLLPNLREFIENQ